MFSDFIGIPFQNRQSSLEACDCYGLIRLVYSNVLNINVPQPKSSAFISKNIENEYLKETSKNWHETKTPKKFDVVAMAHDGNHPNIVQHFGIILDNGKMLHTLKGVGSHIVNIKDYQYFIRGYFRHENINI